MQCNEWGLHNLQQQAAEVSIESAFVVPCCLHASALVLAVSPWVMHCLAVADLFLSGSDGVVLDTRHHTLFWQPPDLATACLTKNVV